MEKLQNEKLLKCGCSNNSYCKNIYFLVNPTNAILSTAIYNEKQINHIVIVYNDELEDKDTIFNLTAGCLSFNLKNGDLENNTFYNMLHDARIHLNEELEEDDLKLTPIQHYMKYPAHNITLLNASINDPDYVKSLSKQNKKIIETFYLNKLILDTPTYRRMLILASKAKIYYHDKRDEILNEVFNFTGINWYKPLDDEIKFNNKKILNLILLEQESKKDIEHIIYMYNVSDNIYKSNKRLYKFKFKIEEIKNADNEDNEGIDYSELLNIDIIHDTEKQTNKKYEYNNDTNNIIDILNNEYVNEELRDFIDYITTDNIETVEFEK